MCKLCILVWSKKIVVPGLKEVIFPLYSALVGLYLEFFVHFGAAKNSKDINYLERVTRLTKGLEHLAYKEWLKELRLLRLKKRKLHEISSMPIKYLKQRLQRQRRLVLCSVVTRGTVRNIQHRRFSLNIRKHFLLWEWLSTGFLGRLCGIFNPAWTWSCAPSYGCPCLSRVRLYQEVPSNFNHTDFSQSPCVALWGKRRRRRKCGLVFSFISQHPTLFLFASKWN